MRNRLLYTPILPTGSDSITLDVSRLIADRYQVSREALLLDPFLEISQAIRSQVPQGVSRLALTNFGILVEPELNLTPSRLLLDLAVDYDVILHWEGSVVHGRKFVWDQGNSASIIEFPENILHRVESNV